MPLRGRKAAYWSPVTRAALIHDNGHGDFQEARARIGSQQTLRVLRAESQVAVETVGVPTARMTSGGCPREGGAIAARIVPM